MDFEGEAVWAPGERELESSVVTDLVRAVGVERYDDLFEVARADPWRYWRSVMEHLRVQWDRWPTGYVDLSAGREFPAWFPDGRLNWVNTVFAWAHDPVTAARLAVVAEHEDGSIDQVTYADLETAVLRCAGGLASLGVGRGDRVGLLMESGVEATVTLLAVAALGGIVVPLFSGFGTDAVLSRLDAAGATTIIGTTGFDRRGRFVDTAAILREARAALPTVQRLILKGPTAQGVERDADWHEIAGSSPIAGPVSLDPNDPFMVIFTSGTTGRPKGVVHTHGSFPIKIVHDAAVHFDLRPGDVFCWPADMGWIAGTLVLSCALLRGATLVCYDGAPDFPDCSRMSRLIERHRITHFGSAPTLIRGLAARPDDALAGDLSTLRLLITAGEVIDPEHFVWFQRNFGRGTQPLINYTGGTEAAGALLASVVVRPIGPSAFNTVSPGVDVDVVDPGGGAVTDAPGELVVREPFVGMTRSFWDDDERYLETYWRTIPGLWVHGDVAVRRADASFVLMGRSDDTIMIAGKRVGPAEVEQIVVAVAGVAEAAAIGVPDSTKGERLILFVVAEPAIALAEADLCRIVSDTVERQLGRPFRPSAVHAVGQLPKTRSSKTMRRIIRSVYSGLPLGDLSSLDDPAALTAIEAAAASGATAPR
ncbi:MAG: AMP-binding protein [Ilumatobacteraceae bacterium]